MNIKNVSSKHVDAFHIVNTIDPLAESDEENADEHVRRDYSECSRSFLDSPPWSGLVVPF